MCIVSGLGIWVGVEAASGFAGPSCKRYRCSTLAADAFVKVFQARNRHLGREVLYQSSFVRWLPGGRVTALGDQFEPGGRVLTRLALTGRFVAAAIETASKAPPFSIHVYRVNAATGSKDVVPAVPAGEDEFGENARGVTDIVVTRAGTVAWLVGETVDMPGISRVFELPPGSRQPVVVGSGPVIVPGSLAAVPGHLYWSEGTLARGVAIK
jgi:hypothetical protein